MNCIFCDAKPNGENRWECGTIGPDNHYEYTTGKDCDLKCFRDGFLRCHDLLVRIVDGSTPMAFKQDGYQLPLEIYKDILREVSEN